MQFLKSFETFINEGAWVDPKDTESVFISVPNRSSNNDEVLKTTSTENGRDFSMSPFIVYWGLTYKDYTGQVDHEGRFKYTMDLIKKAESDGNSIIKDVSGNSGEAVIAQLVKYNFETLGIPEPDYVCAVGSTEGLAGMLGRSINKIFPSATLIQLNKIIYLNAVDAFDFVEFKKQVERQLIDNPQSNTFPTVKKFLIDTYINKKKTNSMVMDEVNKASTPEELERVLIEYGISTSPGYDPELSIVFNDKDTDGKMLIPFIVRSSKRNVGGSRSLWKSKYNYEETAFLNAVYDCITNNKKMVISDDNKNSGIDIKSISAAIINIAKDIFVNQKEDQVINRIKRNFSFYMMYDMHHVKMANDKIADKKAHLDKKGNQVYTVDLSNEVLQNFKDYLKSMDRESFLKSNVKYAEAGSQEVALKNKIASQIFSKTVDEFGFLIKRERAKGTPVSYATLYKTTFKQAWDKVSALPEFRSQKPKALAALFIKAATKTDWLKSNSRLSKDEVINILKS